MTTTATSTGFTKIDNGAIERSREVGPSAFLVYAAIARHVNEVRRAWPGIDRLAAMTGLSPRSVRYAIDRLEKARWLVVERQAGQRNVYRLPPVQSMATDCQPPEISKAVDCQGVGQPVAAGEATSCQGVGQPVAAEVDPRTRPKNKTKGTRPKEQGRAPSKKFIRPTLEEVRAYCRERKNQINPEQFLARYESNGWLVGKSKMKDWKATIRYWEQNGFSNGNGGESKKPSEPIKYRA